MRLTSQIKLYSFTAPLALLPLMNLSFSDIAEYLQLKNLMILILTGLADVAHTAVILALADLFS